MTTKFIPTHTLTIDGRTQAVAVVDDDWTPCAPTAGAQLVLREEWEAEGSVSYTLDDDERLCCNDDAFRLGNVTWELSEITEAGVAGERDGHEDRRHDDGEVTDDDGVSIPAPSRARIAWANESLAADYRLHYRAARG